MSNEGCRIFWKKCIYCGAIETSMHVYGIKEWTHEGEVVGRAPHNVSVGKCPWCEEKYSSKINQPKEAQLAV